MKKWILIVIMIFSVIGISTMDYSDTLTEKKEIKKREKKKIEKPKRQKKMFAYIIMRT